MSGAVLSEITSSDVFRYSAHFPLNAAEAALLRAANLQLPPALERAAPKRQAEFLAGRYCSIQALRLAGGTALSIGIGADRGPVWPRGWVGSISHSEGLVSAAVARTTHLAGLGIDTESILSQATVDEIRHLILVPGEASTGWNEREFLTLAFSAKESLYKCLRPLTGKYFDFQDACLHGIDRGHGVFKISLINSIGGGFDSGWTCVGRFELREGRMHTAIELKTVALPA